MGRNSRTSMKSFDNNTNNDHRVSNQSEYMTAEKREMLSKLAKDDNQNEEDTYKQLQKVVDDAKNKKGDTYELMKKKYKKKLKNSQTTLNSDQMSEVTLDGHAAPQVGCLIVVAV